MAAQQFQHSLRIGVVDIQAASRTLRGAPDTAAMTHVLTVEGPAGPITTSSTSTAAIFPSDDDVYRLDLTVPEPDAVAIKGATFSVTVLLPRPTDEWRVEVVAVDAPVDAARFDDVAGRHVLAFAFEQDPPLSVIWRYYSIGG